MKTPSHTLTALRESMASAPVNKYGVACVNLDVRVLGWLLDDIEAMQTALAGVNAALTQPATFPADVEAARSFAKPTYVPSTLNEAKRSGMDEEWWDAYANARGG